MERLRKFTAILMQSLQSMTGDQYLNLACYHKTINKLLSSCTEEMDIHKGTAACGEPTPGWGKAWGGRSGRELFCTDRNPPPTATSCKRIDLNWFNLVFDFSLPRSILFSNKLNWFSPSWDCSVCNSNWYAISLPLSHPRYFPILSSPPMPPRGWVGTWLLARAKLPQPRRPFSLLLTQPLQCALPLYNFSLTESSSPKSWVLIQERKLRYM